MKDFTTFSLAQWLEYIEQERPEHIVDLGLERTLAVGTTAQLLDFTCPVITVAGTNGKGSTVAILATLLQAAGLSVGTYTSPHLFSFNERIQLNGQSVSDKALCEAFVTIETHRQGKILTFFEYTTLAAFAVFQQANPKLDVIILEIGLGGRLDAVNVVSPNMAIITSISFDHEHILGHTLSAIAGEKAGILRKHIPVILSKEAKVDTIQEALIAHQNPVWSQGENFDIEQGQTKSWRSHEKVIRLPAYNLPESSVSLALAAYTVFSETFFPLPELSKVINYIEQKTMIGRFYTLEIEGIPVTFDVAHNPASAKMLAHKLQQNTGNNKIIAVWASLHDKNLPEIIAPMLKLVSNWFVGSLVDVLRSSSVAILEQTLKANKARVSSHDTIWEAFQNAQKEAKDDDRIVVFGSFYTVAAILGRLLNPNLICKDFGLSV